MSSGIRSDASGTFGALTFGGVDAVTIDADGILAGSYKAGSIVASDFADGALIENAPVGLGYGPGAGGTVTQATSKSTAVTLNKPSGRITMAADSMVAGATATFVVNNTLVASADTISANAMGTDNYLVNVVRCSDLSFRLRITNISGATQAEPVVIEFNLHKGATS